MEERNDVLQHYGVKGMRWGVRRNASKAFAKSARKAERIDTKRVKYQLKAAKLQKKATKKMANATNKDKFMKAVKMQAKANKYQLKSAKLQKKGKKWTDEMEKTFSDVKRSSISAEHMDAGKKYAYMLMNG